VVATLNQLLERSSQERLICEPGRVLLPERARQSSAAPDGRLRTGITSNFGPNCDVRRRLRVRGGHSQRDVPGRRATSGRRSITGAAQTNFVPDNPKVGVTADRYEPDFQRSYQERAAHYRAVVIPARPYRPNRLVAGVCFGATKTKVVCFFEHGTSRVHMRNTLCIPMTCRRAD